MQLQIFNDQDQQLVSGRELHKALEIKTQYKDWFPRMIDYGFEEGKDFSSKMSESTGGRPSIQHELSINMAKEISMIQRTPQGKAIRQYLIDVENAWNSPEQIMNRALQISNRIVSEQRKQIEDMKPKALFADAVETSRDSILIGQLSKLIKQNGVDVGQNRLFAWLRENGYLIKSGENYNMPTQYSMEREWFEVKVRTINNPDGSVRTTKTTKVTGKGQIYFVNKFIQN